MATVISSNKLQSQRSKSISESQMQSQSATMLKKPQFDPLKHQPPRIDFFGYNKEMKKKIGDEGNNVLGQDVRIPEWWSKPGVKDEDKNTRTKVNEKRRAEKVPHISYDIDGDGYVGGRDYVIAKLYDKDLDGRLNTQEKKNAIAAVKNGVEQDFVWNVEVSGGARPWRLLQKRGVFVDAEDFMPVRSTYPEHPDSKIIPKVKDRKELEALRRKENKDAIEYQKKQWELKNPASVEMQFIKSEYLVDNPKHTSINQRKEKELQEARRKAGLSETHIDIKNTKQDPSLNFVEKPTFATKTLLDNQRKDEMINEFKKLDGNFHTFKDVQARIDEREKCHLRLGYRENQTKTKGQIDAERKKQIIDNLTQKYGDVTVGIHGQELPKFESDLGTKEWWKFNKGYNQHPQHQSALELKEKQKFWAKDDNIKLSDIKEEPAPIDAFKVIHEKQHFKNNVADKIHEIDHWKGIDNGVMNTEFQKGYSKTLKWSELDGHYRCNGDDRLFDKIIKSATIYENAAAEAQQRKMNQTQKTSPYRATNIVLGGVDTSRANQSTNRGPHQNDNDTSHTQNGQAAQDSIHKRQPSKAPVNLQNPYNDQSSMAQPNNLSKQMGNQSVSQNNMTGLSFVGRTTLFSRVNQSPQIVVNKSQNKSINSQGNMQGNSTMVTVNNNGQNSTANQSILNRTDKSSNSTFKDAVQRGVLSGVGLLKK